MKLRCFSGGSRRPNAGFTVSSHNDLAKLFAIHELQQMNEASVIEASKRQRGLDAIS